MLKQLRTAISQLKPEEVRAEAERPLRIILKAATPESAAALERCLMPAGFSAARREGSTASLVRFEEVERGSHYQLAFCEAGQAPPQGSRPGFNAFEFDLDDVDEFVATVLAARDDLSLALARRYTPFRSRVTRRLIQAVARENAMFSMMSALPNVIPSLASIPWVFGEFASDTAVLTMNQIRLAFLLAGASDHPIGFNEQRNEIGSIVAGAFGWRALAREAAGKVPFGGGLIPKAAISYAGTWVAGVSLERFYRAGYGLSRNERKLLWDQAFEKGREVASQLLPLLKRQKQESAGLASAQTEETPA